MIDSDDLEPIDELERCDAIFGAYHIGLYDETRAELALIFDWRLLPEPGFLDKRLSSIIGRADGRIVGFCDLASFTCAKTALDELLRNHMHDGGRLGGTPFEALVAVVTDLPKAAVVEVDLSLKAYTAYLGLGELSVPSHLRTLVIGSLERE